MRVLVDRRGYWMAVECSHCGERLRKHQNLGSCGGCGTLLMTRKYRAL